LDGWTIVGVECSYGEVESADDAEFTIEIRGTNYAVASSINYTHPQSQRNYAFAPGSSVTVSQGQTINVNLQSGGLQPEASAEGYTVTLTLTIV
jgi:hypothetical protein